MLRDHILFHLLRCTFFLLSRWEYSKTLTCTEIVESSTVGEVLKLLNNRRTKGAQVSSRLRAWMSMRWNIIKQAWFSLITHNSSATGWLRHQRAPATEAVIFSDQIEIHAYAPLLHLLGQWPSPIKRPRVKIMTNACWLLHSNFKISAIMWEWILITISYYFIHERFL